jgi:hypothetical protein
MSSPFTPRRRRSSIEQQMQIDIIRFCDAKAANCSQLHLLFHTPNGGKRTDAEAGIMKAMGVRAGVSDLHLPVAKLDDLGQPECIGLWIELKKPGEKPNSDQYWWMKQMHRQGHKVAVHTTVYGALKEIADYLRQDWSHELEQMKPK